MGIDIRNSILLSKSKSQSNDSEESARAAQKAIQGKLQREIEGLQRKLRITQNIFQRNLHFLQERLNRAERVLNEHGLMEEYRNCISSGSRISNWKGKRAEGAN